MKDEWTIGNLIKKLRESQGIKQNQLCRGICSVSTLCQFENGERELGYFLVTTLIQRLGYGLDKYEFYGSNEEWLQWKQMCDINQFWQKKQEKELCNELDRYQCTWKISIEKNSFQKQFVTLMEGVLEKWRGNYKNAEVLFQKSISYTVPEWKEMWNGKSVVSIRELEILVELGDIYEQIGEKEKAYATWKLIWNYIEQRQSRIAEMLLLYTLIVVKIAPYLLEKHSYWEGVGLCQKALKALSEYSRVDNWSGVLYWKGKFQESLVDIGEVKEEELIKTYKRAYYVARLFEESERVEELKICLESRGIECIK